MLLRATGDAGLLDVGEDELRTLEGWARRADTAALVAWIKLFSGLDFQLRTTPYGHLPLELTVVEALVGGPEAGGRRPEAGTRRPEAARPTAPPAAPPPVRAAPPPARVEPAPAAPEPEPAAPLEAAAPEPEPEAAAAAEPAPTQPTPTSGHEAFISANADFTVLERVESLWEDIKRDVRPRNPMLQALLKDVRPIDVEGNTIILLAASAFHKSNLEKPQNSKILEDVINKQLGAVFAIRCTIETKTETRDLRGQIREARKDELVRAAMNIFEAHIVDIEPET
jgi:DNA polymerase-3 subunit gamma/tau